MTDGPPAGPRVVLGRETSPTPSREVSGDTSPGTQCRCCLTFLLIVMSNYFLLITTFIPSNILQPQCCQLSCLLTTSPLLQARDTGHVSHSAPHVSRLPTEIMDKFSGQTREVGG